MRINWLVGPGFGAMCAAKIRRADASFGCDPWGSANEHGHKGYTFLSS